jgi:hypothetical protein
MAFSLRSQFSHSLAPGCVFSNPSWRKCARLLGVTALMLCIRARLFVGPLRPNKTRASAPEYLFRSLKGTGFSPYIQETTRWALAPEGTGDSRSDRQTQVPLRSSQPSETHVCQSGFNLLHALESGFHGHSGSADIALKVSEQITRLVPLIDGEFSRGGIPFGIEG